MKTQAQPGRGRSVRKLLVRVLEGADAGAQCEAQARKPLALGSAPDNDLVLRDPNVSRYHLELRQAKDGIQIIDLGSLNGTYVRELRIERAVVPPGSRVLAGQSLLALEDGAIARVDQAEAASAIPGLIGASSATREIAELVRKLASTSASVLIQGETGTGKEVVARAIHDLGPPGRPFVVVDCGSLPPTLIASELFGHERGAFTGADSQRAGAFERAHGGTVFLDEVGELPLDLQPVLLGALERRRFRRLGGRGDLEVDVRVLAATNRDLRAEVNTGSFRADLYYRLAVARIVIPPLRDRPEDIEPLVAHFVEQITGSSQRTGFGFAALAAMRAHRWSGNVRELRNVVEAALAMGQFKLEQSEPSAPFETTSSTSLPRYREARAEALARFERSYLGELIKQCGGNASQAARLAAMDRPYLLNLLRRHGLR